MNLAVTNYMRAFGTKSYGTMPNFWRSVIKTNRAGKQEENF
jgi:hypothetical protein